MTNLYLLEDLLADTCYCRISINEFGIRVKLVLQALYFVNFGGALRVTAQLNEMVVSYRGIPKAHLQ